MMGHLFKNSAVVFVAVLLLLPGCLSRKNAEVELSLRKKAELELVLRESEQDIRKRDFDGALRVYGAALRKYPGDRALLTNYHKAVEDIRDAADNAFDKEEFALAGRTYAFLLRNFPPIRELAGDLSFDRKYLRARLKECSDRLSERALKQYRQGDFPAAISLWKNILEFEPGNAGVRKALDTATTQLRNLRGKTE
jgi:tetratricopeptide (TPR) repeat protein